MFQRTPTERARRELRVTVRHTGRTTTVTATGRIDLATEGPWSDAVMAACVDDTPTTRVVVDITGVTHLSWASATVLLRAHNSCARRARALHVLACGPVLTGLQITGLDDNLTVIPTPHPTPAPTPIDGTGWLIA